MRERAVAKGEKLFTIEEYFDFENASVDKHEYYKSEIFAMSGAKLSDNILPSNIYLIREQIEGK